MRLSVGLVALFSVLSYVSTNIFTIIMMHESTRIVKS